MIEETSTFDESNKLSKEVEKSMRDTYVPRESMAQGSGICIMELKQKLASLREQSAKVRLEIEDFNQQKKFLTEKWSDKTQLLNGKMLERESTIMKLEPQQDDKDTISLEVDNQQKVASRRSYIYRIIELAKNSKKQDANIVHILQDTRQLQIESNSIQERLNRTYAMACETMLRDTKDDPVRRHAYRLLTSLHEGFGQISDTILATDRLRREIAELEKKLADKAYQSFDIDNMEADLNAIMRKNDLLQLGRNQS